MKILWLYKHMRNYNFDHFLHMDVAKYMNGLEEIELKAYGPNIRMAHPYVAFEEHTPIKTLAFLYEKFPFDVIIINTKSRMFEDYLPKYAIDNTRGEIRTGEWLPKDFVTFRPDIKRIVIEEDYHYEDGDSWYEQRGISLILQRHYCNVDFGNSQKSKVKHLFFPFSVDENIFKDYGEKRIEKIKYLGSINAKYYIDRATAIEILKREDLIEPNFVPREENDSYPKCLNRYVCHLSGQSIYHILPAKVFEIAASGSVLLTNANPKSGIQKVFCDTSYAKYEDDYSNLIPLARKILNEPEYRKEIVASAKKDIIQFHTHETRTKELLKIIESN